MTNEQYLQTLNVLEGNGDTWGKTETSPKFGITKNGIERITRNLILKDDKGNYTADAIALQNKLDPKLKEILLNKAKWDKKGGKLTDWADLKDVEKAGEGVWAELALATRDINKRRISMFGAQPLSEELEDRICLAAHNRPSLLLKDEKIKEAIQSNNEEVVRHEFLNNMRDVDDDVKLGIRRRLASLFNSDWKNVSVIDAWNSFDQNGPEGIAAAVDSAYQNDFRYTAKRLKDVSDNQAIFSRYGTYERNDKIHLKAGGKPFPNEDIFMKELMPKNTTAIKAIEGPAFNEPKQPQQQAKTPTAWEMFTNAVRPFFEPLLGNSNQVANNPQNILNNENGENI